MHVLADELQRGVAHEGARQEPRLGQHLEAVADAERRHALLGAALDLAHHRRVRRHRADPEVIAIGEAARQHDEIDRLEIALAMPDHDGSIA
jgi:hypothetical protein